MLTITTASCTAGERITDIFGSIDRTAPEIVEYDLLSSGTFYVLYSEEVVLDEVILGETRIWIRDSGTSFRIVFPFSLETGTEYTLFITAKDACGNTQRTAFFLTGPNDDVPEAVINEISPEAPDRVEILILEDGNTAGMVIKDGAGDNYSSRFLLPPIDVKENDIILIYWNGDAEEEAIIREDDDFRDMDTDCSQLMAYDHSMLILDYPTRELCPDNDYLSFHFPAFFFIMKLTAFITAPIASRAYDE